MGAQEQGGITQGDYTAETVYIYTTNLGHIVLPTDSTAVVVEDINE